MRITILTNRDSKWGLSRDAKIVSDLLLTRGHEVAIADFRNPPTGQKAHVNIHLEIKAGRWFNHAIRNVLVPNQEWFPTEWIPQSLLRYHGVFCKTHHAYDIYKALGFKNTVYTGFTSLDFAHTDVEKQPTCYHIAGNSMFKGTQYILANWQPDWPTIYVYGANEAHKTYFDQNKKPNVVCKYGYMSEHEMIQTVNRHTWAIQPSASEGFGHCIAEPLSAGLQVVTLDAPPMNEFTPTQKLPAKQIGKHHLGNMYAPIGFNIDFTATNPDTRKWWVENDMAFRSRFIEYLERLVK